MSGVRERGSGADAADALRVAAVADVHVKSSTDPESVRERFQDVTDAADVLVIAGDLTDHGRLEEAEILQHALQDVRIPVIAVFGNHDHESGNPRELKRVLRSGGVRVLDHGETTLVDGVGFVGAKGFCGGFGKRIVRAFGETALKEFVTESVTEADALRDGLNAVKDRPRVAVTHFAPVEATVQGEPPEIHAFLGTSRLGDAVDAVGAEFVVHGHAHLGAHEGHTAKGVPVFNVSLPVLEREGIETAWRVFEVPRPAVQARHA